MSSISIVGGGQYISEVNTKQLVIGINFHYKKANLLVSMDTSVLDPMTRGNLDNYNHQPIITTYDNYNRYRDNHRVLFYNEYKWHRIAGVSSGLLAISFCISMKVKHLDLYGFNDLTDKNSDRYIKFSSLINSDISYTLHG
jgi:hypothetical protein